eukprot:TRINITY_DN27293_c0_g1_i1.p1 TRINITY_DN27293_c0_g1~~TRINITY_DN27293_c0_g1_i1.p1  ORF type:complete len:941 (+),score=165.49 TRINITY_DN27293_c0_g1_i1:405-2825(+)
MEPLVDQTPFCAEEGDDVQERAELNKWLAGFAVRKALCAPPATSPVPQMQDDVARSLIQFSCSTYYCTEDEEEMTIEVMRLGSQDLISEVFFAASNVSSVGVRRAKMASGKQHRPVSGKLVFLPGENEKRVKIPILRSGTWSPSSEFQLELTHPRNAGLGKNLFQCRIKVIDQFCFPTNRYKRQLEVNRVDDIPRWSLLMEYFRMTFSLNLAVRLGTFKTVLADVMHNCFYLVQLFMAVHLVDSVLSPSKNGAGEPITGSREVDLICIAVVILVLFFSVRYLDYRRSGWSVGAGSAVLLRTSLLKSFLNCDSTSRRELDENDFLAAVVIDAEKLSSLGYANMLGLTGLVGRLLVMLMFQVAAPLTFGHEELVPLASLSVAFPCFFGLLVLLRQASCVAAERARSRCEQDVAGHVLATMRHCNLIEAYGKRSFFEDRSEDKMKCLSLAVKRAGQAMCSDLSIFPVVSMVLMSACIILIGRGILEGANISMGIFLASLKVIADMGDAYASIYKSVLEMNSLFDSLDRVVTCLNLNTDLAQRMALNRDSRDQTVKMRAEIRMGQDTYGGVALDKIPIMLKEVRLGPGLQMLTGQLDIAQGELVSLVGPRNGGKTTVLKLLGGALLHEQGLCYVPCHLRAVHLSAESLFFKGSLRENLCFGMALDDSDADVERVRGILQMLELADVAKKYLDSDEAIDCSWLFSPTQLQLLSLARALVANPEMLCIHRAAVDFNDEEASARIVGILKKFVKSKGLCQDRKTAMHLRRPRTCILASASLAELDSCDSVFSVSEEGGMERIASSDVTVDMLG